MIFLRKFGSVVLDDDGISGFHDGNLIALRGASSPSNSCFKDNYSTLTTSDSIKSCVLAYMVG